MTEAATIDAGSQTRPGACPAGDGLRPVFIMGPHRSGTTILYRILGETGLFNVVTAFHVLCRDRLDDLRRSGGEAEARAALADRFARQGLTDRRIDAMPITPDLPEEYAWVLDRQGRRPRLDRRTLPGFTAFCRAVHALQQPDRPLLLKNPFDADNGPFIARALPESRFVFIHRDPAAVVSSQVRAIRSILAERNGYIALINARYRRLYQQPVKLALARAVYGERWPLLVWQVSHHVARTNARVLRQAGRLGRRALHVTYRDLCGRPEPVLARILDFLALEPTASFDVAALIRPRHPALAAEVREREGAIRRDNAAYCEAFGV